MKRFLSPGLQKNTKRWVKSHTENLQSSSGFKVLFSWISLCFTSKRGLFKGLFRGFPPSVCRKNTNVFLCFFFSLVLKTKTKNTGDTHLPNDVWVHKEVKKKNKKIKNQSIKFENSKQCLTMNVFQKLESPVQLN